MYNPEIFDDPNDPEYYREYSHSHLKDGRLLVLRGSKRHFLMTPDPVGSPTYEPIAYENDPMHLHKISISHDETKISYMKQIIYTDAGKVMLHDIESGTNIKVSTDDSLEYRYPNFDGSVK
jgi:hypothetical protein